MTGNISNKRKAYIFIMKALMFVSVGITCALVLFLIGYVLIKGIPNISWELVSTKPSYLSGKIGILPDILNTLYIILATLIVVLPLGVGAAVYLTEYARNKKLVAAIEYAAETLSGIPLYHLWFGRYAFFLSVSEYENLTFSRSHDPCDYESSYGYENNPGKSENCSTEL